MDPLAFRQLTTAGVRTGAVLGWQRARVHDDLEVAHELGLDLVRLDVPWAECAPRHDQLDGGVIEAVRAAATQARSFGMQVWFRLLQPRLPHWFDDEGGLSDQRAVSTHWPRWAEQAAEHLGDVADGWVPFEAPYAMAHRIEPNDARRHAALVHHLMVGWRDAWRILHGPAPVVASIDLATLASEAHSATGGMWVGAFRDGRMRIPGRVERRLDQLAGSCDILGLALRTDVEATLYRIADVGGGLPLALTFRPTGNSDAERAHHLAVVQTEVDRAAEEVQLRAVLTTALTPHT